MRTLYWLTDDLRLEDNPTLVSAIHDKTLDFVFCLNQQRFRTDRFGNRKIGKHRWRLLRESLFEFQSHLAEFGQILNIMPGNPRETFGDLLASGCFDRVVRTRQHAHEEMADWRYLVERFPKVRFCQFDTSTLYRHASIQFDRAFPETFSQFRRLLDDVPFRSMASVPKKLPCPSNVDFCGQEIVQPVETSLIAGGAAVGMRHVQNYFQTCAASRYKETRNELSGERFSTGFSPWLAVGCVSPMQIVDQLNIYESNNGQNESTRWILFELMWREFFRWHARYHDASLYKFSGITGKRPLTTFYRERFLKWCSGGTPWPIVNACMNELRETGCLSNRGRQIVASCLVNELGLDWRCGAGYFEEMLIDYDPCSNWGNWQYIAGVGSDPRGGRHFNLEKQAATWDSDGRYRQRWSGAPVTNRLDSVDYYDWPRT